MKGGIYLEKLRVYQVAKEKKLSSDALISMLKGLNFDVKSHMSVVDDGMLAAITQKIAEEKKSSIQEVQRQKIKEATRKKAEPRPARPVASAPHPRPEEDRRGPRPAGPGMDRPRRRLGGDGSRPAVVPLPAKDDERKRPKKRGQKEEEPRKLEELGERGQKNAPAVPGGADLSGRWRGGGGGRGKRRRQVDAKAIQENVRKTLSQMNEGRTRRRYERVRKEEGEGGEGGEERSLLRVMEYITVSELAESMGVKTSEVITACLELGLVATINQRLDMDVITTVADEFGFDVQPLEEEDEEVFEEEEEEETTGEPAPRAPVVTVMGHVDHGKTSLLDFLRKSEVAAGESGGITQHIGAYVVHLPEGKRITFLDTPGHAAFTAMRARGARVTDLVILVVAADDNVMPQTIEAIDHARAAQVPIVVAINKIDLPTADPGRIKRQLAEQNVLVEEWGGKVPVAEISAKTGTGVERLLELVLLEAELLELKAVPQRRARGTIIEGQLDKGRGPVATILVQEGTLRQGDPFVTGVFSGRVRALLDEHLQRLEEAGPSVPVQVLGLAGVPQAGDTFVVTPSEREAREISSKRQQVKREQDFRRIRAVTLTDLHDQIQEGKIKELNVVVKGDVDGSVEAINQELGAIVHEEVRIVVIHSGVGPISESDVLLASASNAIIIGFRVQPEASARALAGRYGVDIRSYDIIYRVVEELRAALAGLLAPEVQERIAGVLQVRQVFASSRIGTVAGCMVQKGKISRSSRVRVRRGGAVMFTGSIASLRRFKDDVREVLEGYECGVGLEGFDDVKVEDLIEVIEVVESARAL
ncbi:MAG: translation initiation factor IF-2 [Candidatus Handelsmanbacteria bacterium]|nr:translation initiation factor IF-2 [Candidatus Handelsmanbacteria bacterium]